jgi:hypothetical protein
LRASSPGPKAKAPPLSEAGPMHRPRKAAPPLRCGLPPSRSG